MPREAYRIKSVMICDDVRREITGKDILIGVYNEVIVARKMPINLGKLFFRFHIESNKTDLSSFELNVKDSDGEEVFSAKGSMTVADAESPIILVVHADNIVFPKADTFSINLGIGHTPKQVGAFEVRLPKDAEQERFRIQ